MQHVAILGSGVIGLSTAYALRQRGVPRVTVLEGGPGPSGASLVNAGWICPGHADPLPSPGLVGRSARWMLRSDSPLYVRPTLDPGFLRWLVAFWRNCTARHFAAGLDAMAALNAETYRLFDAYADAGVRFEMSRDGLLLAFLGARRMESELRHLEHHPGLFGSTPRVLWGSEARSVEPGLSAAVTGAVWLANERHVTPGTLMAGLAQWLDERNVEIRVNTPVTGIETHGWTARLHMKGECLDADAVVIAVGARAGAVAKMLGVAMPIQAGKGYSLDYAAPPGPVGYPISLAEASMAVTPMAGGVRLAGTMELSGINTTVRRERVAALARGASLFLEGWSASTDGAVVGSGLRPLTPDGLPVIGMLPGHRNVAISTGHGMLGLTMAPATAEALADTLLTGCAPDVLAPFSPDRFA